MKSKLLTIGQAADRIGVSIQTLRRWDESGRLTSFREKQTGHRYYQENVVEDFIIKNIINLSSFAKEWVSRKAASYLPILFYCQDISIFQARLSKLENDLSKINKVSKFYPLLTAITGEIGNNSFDHNLGNWSDVPGIFFAYDLKKGLIILADRGQGILKTLRNARPKLATHQAALKMAFTEIVSGRSPEYRGNGLKFVKEVVSSNNIELIFQSGDAELRIKNEAPTRKRSGIPKLFSGAKSTKAPLGGAKADKSSVLEIKKSNINLSGCLALIKF